MGAHYQRAQRVSYHRRKRVISWRAIVGIFVALLILWLLTQFVIVPYIQVEIKRRASRDHIPQPEELWVQDGELLYIDAINPSGVELMTFNPKTKRFDKWKDSWAEWQIRLKVRSVYYTGQRRPLGDA